LEVERPDVVGTLGAEPLGWDRGIAESTALLGLGGNPQTLLAPDPLHPLAIQRPSLGAQVPMGAAVAPAGTLGRELAQTCPQGSLIRGNLGEVALGGAVLAGDPARPTLGEAEAVLKGQDRLAPSGRA